jgi:glycosyltransferase involved in cell wall biosynthesis
VHTALAKRELLADFGIQESQITAIPFGLNDTIPKTELTSRDARVQLGIDEVDRVVLFFGQIAPYKGLEYLIEALSAEQLAGRRLHVVIAGKVKRGFESYWETVREAVAKVPATHRVTAHVRFIPDGEVERYFKAADLVVLPYTAIFQSGVPFLAFSFGLPVVATDVGSLREDIRDDINGYICAPRDSRALASVIARYFDSEMYRLKDERRAAIRMLALEKHSWEMVGRTLSAVYKSVLVSR